MIIGLDMGGTHVDAVIIEDGKIIKMAKHPIDKTDLFQSIWTALIDLLPADRSQIKQVNLSTTISTNAIVEDQTARVGMLIQSGPGLPHDFLACGEAHTFVSGYSDHRGETIQPLDKQAIKQDVAAFKEQGIEACGVVTKFSTRNPNHEREMKEVAEQAFDHVTMGHTLSGKLNFPRRVNTTYLNAAVHQTFQQFAQSIKQAMAEEGLSDVPLFVLKADGGTINLAGAEAMPVETILSGPAASFQGMTALLGTDKDALLLDIGGTTTDIFFLVDGVPLFEPLGIQIDGYHTLVRSIYSHSIGIGGDSHVQVVDGTLQIGPRRLGRPIAFGGSEPTPTDAMVTLGKLAAGDQDKARAAMEVLGAALDTTADAVAEQILTEMAATIKTAVEQLLGDINSKPVYTIKALLSDRETRPELMHVIGGPVKVLAPYLEAAFNLPCQYPDHYDVANAVGAALSRTTAKITLVANTTTGRLSIPELGIYKRINRRYTLDDARTEALERLVEHATALGADPATIETEIIAESSFNMVRGFTTSGHNHRIEAQVKPGLIDHVGGMTHHA